MPTNDGNNPGADDSAENKSGQQNDEGDGDAAGNAGDKKQKSGKGNNGDGDDKNAGKIVFDSQEDLDAMITRRVNRALKKKDDDAKLTETQRLEKERDDALRLVADRDLKDSFIAKSGLEFSKGSRIFAMYKDDIEINDAGKATNLDDVIKQAKADFPEMFKPSDKKKGSADAGNGGDGKPTGQDMNSILRRSTGRS